MMYVLYIKYCLNYYFLKDVCSFKIKIVIVFVNKLLMYCKIYNFN